jgi:hypothetical protein
VQRQDAAAQDETPSEASNLSKGKGPKIDAILGPGLKEG